MRPNQRWQAVLIFLLTISLSQGQGCVDKPNPPPVTVIEEKPKAPSQQINQTRPSPVATETDQSKKENLPTPPLTPGDQTPNTQTGLPSTNALPPSETDRPAAQQKLIEVIPPQLPDLSPNVAEIAQMAQAGVSEEILLKYIEKKGLAFELKPEEIVYLKDIGVSEQVIKAMLDRSVPAGRSSYNTEAQTGQREPTSTQPGSASQPSIYADSNVAAPQSSPVGQGASPSICQDQQATTIVNNYFYAPLAPYGSWLYIDTLGWCWRPTVALIVHDWRPYCHGGYWVYTEWGWYWHSTYSWGWAPFHYGRWYLSPRFGWIWVPGYVWAPAWVVWRCNDNYIGWAPLPPSTSSFAFGFAYFSESFSLSLGITPAWFTFVSYSHFCEHDLHRYRLPREHAENVYNNSLVINNIINGDNSTIINAGIPVEQVESRAQRRVPRFRIKEISTGDVMRMRQDLIDPTRQELFVYRPSLPDTIQSVPQYTKRQPLLRSGPSPEAKPALQTPRFVSQTEPIGSRPPGRLVSVSPPIDRQPAVRPIQQNDVSKLPKANNGNLRLPTGSSIPTASQTTTTPFMAESNSSSYRPTGTGLTSRPDPIPRNRPYARIGPPEVQLSPPNPLLEQTDKTFSQTNLGLKALQTPSSETGDASAPSRNPKAYESSLQNSRPLRPVRAPQSSPTIRGQLPQPDPTPQSTPKGLNTSANRTLATQPPPQALPPVQTQIETRPPQAFPLLQTPNMPSFQAQAPETRALQPIPTAPRTGSIRTPQLVQQRTIVNAPALRSDYPSRRPSVNPAVPKWPE